MLSLTANLSERVQYDMENVPRQELLDALVELEQWREPGMSPDDVKKELAELEQWRNIEVDGDYPLSPNNAVDMIGDLVAERDGLRDQLHKIRNAVISIIAED
jgi:hypothetical protein